MSRTKTEPVKLTQEIFDKIAPDAIAYLQLKVDDILPANWVHSLLSKRYLFLVNVYIPSKTNAGFGTTETHFENLFLDECKAFIQEEQLHELFHNETEQKNVQLDYKYPTAFRYIAFRYEIGFKYD